MKMLTRPCLLLLTLALMHCQGTSTDEFHAATSIKTPLRISPANATVIESQTLQFTVTGGNPPYTFKIFSGGRPPLGEY
jgi:hypothetical protein